LRLLARAVAVVALVVVGVAVAAVVLANRSGSHAPAADTVTAASRATRPRHAMRRTAPVPMLTGARARTARVPILMYHVVSAPRPGVPNTELYVDAARFAAEVRALRHAGFHGVTLDQVFAAWRRGAPIPRRPIVLSFDDGYVSDYTHAAPALHTAGWAGVLNLELNDLHGKGSLKAWEVRRMLAQGWQVASHTITHPDLTQTPDAQLRSELAGSRAQIEKLFGVAPAFFCYPAGRFDARVVAAVRAAGYAGATTELPGAAHADGNPYELPRVRVNGSDTPQALVARVRAVLGAA
jgi:peptidoglycan/xylan/chitin deacetylase (PgdA/CDA1 family)